MFAIEEIGLGLIMETFLYKSDDDLKFILSTTNDRIDKLFQTKNKNVKYRLLGPSQFSTTRRTCNEQIEFNEDKSSKNYRITIVPEFGNFPRFPK